MAMAGARSTIPGRILLASIFGALLPVACSLPKAATGENGDFATTLEIGNEPLHAGLPRYGLNLGGTGTWGAEQLRSNILINPGFEPVIDRAILIVREHDGARLTDDTAWLARPEGFWIGGQYDVRTGALAGRHGIIRDSSTRTADRLPEIVADAPLTGLQPGDVVALSRTQDSEPAPGWWHMGRIESSPERRPDSPGIRSVYLAASSAASVELLHYSDAIGDRAGTLLPVTGNWRLSFWAKSKTPHSRLKIHFDRGGRLVFINETLAPTSEWRRYEFEISATGDSAEGVLTLALQAIGGGILLDDISLGESVPGPGGFRTDVVATLRSLRPGFLRDWQGQLGDTLDNRIGDGFGHRPVRYRPGASGIQFHYGLDAFLELCQAVGADPWIVAPTTLDDAEWRRFGSYLHEQARQRGFRQIMLEFGNENWNPVFRPAGIPDALAHAAAADRAFRLIDEGSGGDQRITTVLNAQFADPDSASMAARKSELAERIAIAPYFLYRLNAGTSLPNAVEKAFEDAIEPLNLQAEAVADEGKQLAVYEVNLHTTLGNAAPDLRNNVVSGAASGPALARRLLQGTLAGIREQAVYSFSGYDSYLQEGKGLVRLWGVTRDLASPDRFRPTGLALAMLNRVSGGKALPVNCRGQSCAKLTSVAFGRSRLAAVSASDSPIPLRIACQGKSWQSELLDGSNPALGNETAIQVKVTARTLPCKDGFSEMTLPAHSLLTLHR